MSNYSFSSLRIFILILVSLCITTKSIAMVTEGTVNKMPTMSAHCMEMMGDVHTSSPEIPSHHDQNSCGNHYACLGLEIQSMTVEMIELQVEMNSLQSASTYTNSITDGYFALPDPPPRYTL